MGTLRYLTAGESHGGQLTAICCPAGLAFEAAACDADLARRQLGFGRGARQQIERDRATILSGVRYGHTTGAPIALAIANRDAASWLSTMAVESTPQPSEPVRVPRPGHADLTGSLLYGADDLRDVIERASARETAARVACGAVARRLLTLLGCSVYSHVVAVGGVTAGVAPTPTIESLALVDADPLRCLDPAASAQMRDAVVAAGQEGDTLGGVFEVVVFGFHPAWAATSSPTGGWARVLPPAPRDTAIKVSIGLGFAAASLPGSQVHDEIVWSPDEGYGRTSNHAGGLEGGISTGLPIVVRAAMKPIATLMSPLKSVRLSSHEAVEAHVERSDVCAVPAAAVVGEAATALCLAAATMERFGVRRPPSSVPRSPPSVNARGGRDGQHRAGRLHGRRQDAGRPARCAPAGSAVRRYRQGPECSPRHDTGALRAARREGVSRARAHRRTGAIGGRRAERAGRLPGRGGGHDPRRAEGASAPSARRLARRFARSTVRSSADGHTPLARDEARFAELYHERRPLWQGGDDRGPHGRRGAPGPGGRQALAAVAA